MPEVQENVNVKSKRSKSLNEANELRIHEESVRKLQPDKPCHKYQDSLFSWSSGFDNFSGFVNWGFILLLMGGIRLLLENLLRYGIRIDPMQWLLLLKEENGIEHNTSLVLLAYSLIPLSLCLFIEKGLSKKVFEERTGLQLQIINASSILLIPMLVIPTYSKQFSLLGASTVCFMYSVLFLKLWSYIQVNMWCRREWISRVELKKKFDDHKNPLIDEPVENEDKESVYEKDLRLIKYPNNLNLTNLLYFMAIPTLCYELNFPKTDRIRKRFILKRILELLIGIQVMAALFQQWMIPSVKHALIPFSNMDVLKATERLLKLSIPNHLMWLISFYLLFHSWLNFTGELFCFADRNFYLDWWNAKNVNVFWRKWNTVVHRWALRHVYWPMVEIGYGKVAASATVFFISAFFHEFLVSVPLRTFKSWAFVGMMMQMPLAYLSSYMESRYGSRCGNIVVWISLILGQPLCIMMYYHDYVISHYGEALIEQFGHL